MTNFKYLLKILYFIVFFSAFQFENNKLCAQLNSEQQSQIKQYNNLINDYNKQKQYRLAAHYHNKSAFVYWKANMYQEAINSFQQSAELNENVGNYSEKRKIYINIAMIYSDMNQLKNTLKYFEKSLEISRRLNNRADISASLMDVATILIINKEYDKALEKLDESLKIANSLNDARLLRTCYNLMSQCYKAYGNQKKSDEYYNYFLVYDKHVKEEGTIQREGEAVKKISAEQEKSKILESEKLAKILQYNLLEIKKKASEDSLNYALLAAEDSLTKVEREKSEVELKNDLLSKEQKLNELAIENQKEIETKQKLLIYGAAIGLVLLLLIVIGAIFSNVQKRRANFKLEKQNIEIAKQKDEIESKSEELSSALGKIKFQNKNIVQSINYAQRIQEAMLPKEIGMQNLIPDSFIFFKPRDIVSGDFYWFHERNRNGDIELAEEASELINKKIFISAVDCTGHGVPGAFMSMLGFNLLNDIVNKGVLESDKILTFLHKGIRASLNQEATLNRDGMDMALCVIDPVNQTLEYSGAQNPLIYIQDNKVFRIRGNKFPVGGFQVDDHVYDKHIVKIDRPTWCYIFSDGFSDQFGGPQGRKFMAKNFRDLLFEIHLMPMEEQKRILELVINEWIGKDYEQTDDILVIGFKIDISKDT
ncbi:MAG: tetratricopeptide repeat protein [Bacteroidales bacterium]|nr:tetratricopeptide repeat protein [Bacteroidales bacterium]